MAARIRPASVLDLEAAAATLVAAWRESLAGAVPDAALAGLEARRPTLVETWAHELFAGAHLWLALDDGDVVGLAQAHPRRDDDVDVLLELSHLHVLARAGDPLLARALLWTAVGDTDAYAWLPVSDAPIGALLAEAGFREDGATRASGPAGATERRLVRRTPAS